MATAITKLYGSMIPGLEDVLVLKYDPLYVGREALEMMDDSQAVETCMSLAKDGYADILTLGDFQEQLNNDDEKKYAGFRYRFVKAVREINIK